MKVERVLAIEQDTLDQRHDVPSRVVARAHYRHLEDLKVNKAKIHVKPKMPFFRPIFPASVRNNKYHWLFQLVSMLGSKNISHRVNV